VIARIREAFGAEVAVAALFDNPTITGLAVAVDELTIAMSSDKYEEFEF
jgi:hypothetical protein